MLKFFSLSCQPICLPLLPLIKKGEKEKKNIFTVKLVYSPMSYAFKAGLYRITYTQGSYIEFTFQGESEFKALTTTIYSMVTHKKQCSLVA